jgi:hypothetical protein
MNQTNRAIRRHHKERLKSKRLKHYMFLNYDLNECEIMAMLPILIDTPKTYQERKLNWTYKNA